MILVGGVCHRVVDVCFEVDAEVELEQVRGVEESSRGLSHTGVVPLGEDVRENSDALVVQNYSFDVEEIPNLDVGVARNEGFEVQ